MKKRKTELIMFDLDGTLVDAFQAVTNSLNFMFRQIGYPAIDRGTVQRRVGWGEKTLVRSFVEEQILEKALRIYRRHHTEALKKGVKFLPGAKKTLRQLKKEDVILAIASNRPSRFTKIILRQLEIDGLFAHVWCADQAGEKKPHPKILKDILARLKVKPSRAVYIGDMTIDAQAGRRARVKTIVVPTGSCTVSELRRQRPYKIVKNIYHALDHIE